MFALITACNEDDEIIQTTSVTIELKSPKDLKETSPKFKNLAFVLENKNTGEKTGRTISSLAVQNLNVEDGLYDFMVTGDVAYETYYTFFETKKINGQIKKVKKKKIIFKSGKVRGAKDNIKIIGGVLKEEIPLFLHTPSNDFVFSEIFFSRSTTPEGKPYFGGDPYIEIYNNTDKVLYADGLCIATTSEVVQTVDKLVDLKPDFRSTAVVVGDVYRIPGSGKEHPVQPGSLLLIADVAIDHRENNPNSYDLSKANFEWFDGLNADDVDVPEVPNLEKMIQGRPGAWNPNVNGYSSFILFRLDKNITPEQFAKDAAIHFTHFFSFGDIAYTYKENEWQVSNEKVIDAVQCSTPTSFEWHILDPSLDLSWTHSGDNEGFNGHSVKRKVKRVENGRKTLQDTNDSAFDFIPTAKGSPGTIEDLQQ